MTRGKKKAAAGAVIVYLLLSCGLWMFMESFSGFCARISAEEPAQVEISPEGVQIFGTALTLPTGDSGDGEALYYPVYMLLPGELRLAAQLCRLAVD